MHASLVLKGGLMLPGLFEVHYPGRCYALPRVNFVADLRPAIYSLLFKRYFSVPLITAAKA